MWSKLTISVTFGIYGKKWLFYRNFHNIILKCLLFLLFLVQLVIAQSALSCLSCATEVQIAQAQPPSPITGKSSLESFPLLSQEENLLGRKPQEPEKEEEDIAQIHGCSKALAYA